MSYNQERRTEVWCDNNRRVEYTYDPSVPNQHPKVNLHVSYPNRSRSCTTNGVTTRVCLNVQVNNDYPSTTRGLSAGINFHGIPIRNSRNKTTTTTTTTTAVTFVDPRIHEKYDLAKLNDKFAQYVEKVRFLEAQNKKLRIEIERHRYRSDQVCLRVRDLYEAKIDSTKRQISDTKNACNDANTKLQHAEDQLHRHKSWYNQVAKIRDFDKREIENLERQLFENEADITLFKRRIADLESEGQRYKAEAQRLRSDVVRVQKDIENEVFLKSTLDSEKFALKDRFKAIKHTHELALTELASRITFTELDPMKFLSNEAAQQLREIRKNYENEVASLRELVRSRYATTINQIISEIPREPDKQQNEFYRQEKERLRSDVTNVKTQCCYQKAKNQNITNHIEELRRKINSMNKSHYDSLARQDREIAEAKERLAKANRQYDELLNSKLSLEKEIRNYHDLLESQNGLRPCVDRIVQMADQAMLNQSMANHGLTRYTGH